jgi:hypothetical protein
LPTLASYKQQGRLSATHHNRACIVSCAEAPAASRAVSTQLPCTAHARWAAGLSCSRIMDSDQAAANTSRLITASATAAAAAAARHACVCNEVGLRRDVKRCQAPGKALTRACTLTCTQPAGTAKHVLASACWRHQGRRPLTACTHPASNLKPAQDSISTCTYMLTA